jgi:nucleoside-diphosphate-sugar epimerase
MDTPRIIVTGASGFLGRHLLNGLKERYRIFALGRRSQHECHAPIHPNIAWFQVDIGDREPLQQVFSKIKDDGGARQVVHLAAHYDFTGEDHPEYWRTNVAGLRNVLEICKNLNLDRFVFASSVAACAFPAAGKALDEHSPPDGDHLYAVTKRIGEEMLQEYRGTVPSTIMRLAALFSDWCEYPPLFMFLGTWLSRVWKHRVLAGKGISAIPYLHVRDAVSFLTLLLDHPRHLEPLEVVLASPDGAVNHRELYEAATFAHFGRRHKPILLPKFVCRQGLWTMDLAGRLLGERPFERPWMGKYIDLSLTVDASHTRKRLGWSPRPRLGIVRRMPFLIENYKTDPVEWNRRNRAAMKEVRVRSNLRIHYLMERHEQEILERFHEAMERPEAREELASYHHIDQEDLLWHQRVVLRQLMSAVRTREMALFKAYCRDLARRRFELGFRAEEVCHALGALNAVCLEILQMDPKSHGLEGAMRDHITMTIQLGCDEVEEVFEELQAGSAFFDPEFR